ncbi:hypothetical protein D1841_14125 [Neglecta sp. X4]|nr:hypothetical protein [Neglectibacter sp. 59]NBJ74370.1 hypothetical protein [Neglectibacter sp. X4]NCE82134.1 hypothetical protein [Neglectibacter sp. X58]
MGMGMMAFVVKSCKPLQMLHGNLEIFRERLGLCPQHIPPAGTAIKPQPLCIFPAQGDDRRVNIALVLIQVIGHLLQVHLHTIVRKQAVAAEAFGTGAGGYVVRIGFGVQDFLGVILHRAADEIRSCTYGLLGGIVLVFQHFLAVRKILQQFSINCICFTVAGAKRWVSSSFSTPSRVAMYLT